MRASSPTTSGKLIPEHAAIPAKIRIKNAAGRLFQQYGLRVSARQIAHIADSNEGTLIKYFGSVEQLFHEHIAELVGEYNSILAEAKQEYPDNPEAELIELISSLEAHSDDANSCLSQLARASASTYYLKPTPLQAPLNAWRIKERFQLQTLCEKAKFDNSSKLADKLLLLIEGARNERRCFGFAGPSSLLSEAALELMTAHRRRAASSPLD